MSLYLFPKLKVQNKCWTPFLIVFCLNEGVGAENQIQESASQGKTGGITLNKLNALSIKKMKNNKKTTKVNRWLKNR